MGIQKISVRNPGLPHSREIEPGETYQMDADCTVVGDLTASGLTGDVQGPAMTTGEGSGIASATGVVVSSEITKVGKKITTQIFMDIKGLASETTLDDIIGDTTAANSHFGQLLVSESGQIYAGTMTCLQVPTVGVTDIDLNSSSASTGVGGADVQSLADPLVLLAAASAWTLGETQVLTGLPTAVSDFLYLSVGVAGTVGEYAAGQFLIEFEGFEA